MGVHGLWKLLEPAGKAVALESLQNKILGVDVSIWLHQAMKGFQDRKGSPLPNAHLLGIFHRVCKLLFYRIKPVFVFDGGVPVLKKNTIATRRKFKGRAARDAKQVAEQLLKNLVKHKAVRKVLGEKAGRNDVSEDRPRKDENLFELPPMLNDLNEYQSLSSDSEASVKYEPSGEESDSDQDVKYLSPSKVYAMNLDLHTLDVTSENFRSLPADVRHDILSDLKETRKQSSWGRLHEMPKESTDFSSFQLNRLLKRRNVQVSLEEAEKEMGGKVLSMAELEDIMSAQGVKLEDGAGSSKEAQLNAYSKRIASDVATRFLLVSETSKNKDLTSEKTTDARTELKAEDTKSDEKIKLKQEHQDDWSSDESIKAMKVKTKLNDKIKIKQEYEDDWSSEDEVKKIAANENLAERFINENDSLSQAEILALIQNEKNRDDSLTGIPNDVPSTSKTVGVAPSKTKPDVTKPSTSKAAVEATTSKADFIDVSSGEANLKTPTKDKIEVQIRDSPVTVKSDSDNDFDEVLPAEPEIIDKVVSVKRTDQTKNQNIEVVIDKSQSYKPEDDIFADIFPVGEAPKKIIQLTPEKIESQPKTTVVINAEEKRKTPTKIGELQEKVEKFDREKVEIEQKTAQKTPDKMVNYNSKDDNISEEIIDVVIAEKGDQKKLEGRKTESERLSKELQVSEMSSEALKSLESELEDKHEELLAEKGRQERLAASITDQMCAEAQELLRLFGVPYVVAPMEAEAQCAFLDSLSLTEGTITDDSDIWLFGGKKVFKNFFNQKKHVLQYTSTTIQHYLKLERNHMILLALLVGSDYTTGLQGIGPVTAMEVLAAFPPGKVDVSENRDLMIEGLRRFRDWWQAGRPQRSAATQQLRKKVKDVQFYEGFPSLAVVDAYLRPAVDESKESFSWGDLDLQGLREFARMKFGWAQAKADEILLPVAKRVAERKHQRFIDSYFNTIPQYSEGDKKMSKRVKKAVRRMENEEESDSEDVDDPEPKQSRKMTGSQGGSVRKRRAPENEAFGEEEKRPRQKSTASRKKMKELDTIADGDAPSGPKRSKTTCTVVEVASENDGGESSGSKKNSDLPKPRPRQRTSTGVVRSGAKGPPKNVVTGNNSGTSGTDTVEIQFAKSQLHKRVTNTGSSFLEPSFSEEAAVETVQKAVTKRTTQPWKKVTNRKEDTLDENDQPPATVGTVGTVKKATTKKMAQPRKKMTNMEENRSLDTIHEDDETSAAVENAAWERTTQPRKKVTNRKVDTIDEDQPPATVGTVKKAATKKMTQPRKKVTNVEENRSLDTIHEDDETLAVVEKAVTKRTTQPRKKVTNIEKNRSLYAIHEDDESTLPENSSRDEPKPGPSTVSSGDFKPKPGTSKDQPEDPDEEEEAILAALHAMDWDDDPWGGFEPPREKLFFGGVRKNPTKPRRPPQPQPPLPPPSSQPIDTRGYRPGSRTLDRIESRVTQPQLEWNSPSNRIPQRERDRQQAEESKMKAIKMFKAAGAMKTSRLLGEDPASGKRRSKKKKPVAKVKELNLSEESSSDD